MRKNLFWLPLFVLSTLACNMSIALTPSALETPQPVNEVTPTPEIFIALTRAVPGEFRPTELPDPTTTPQPPSGDAAVVTYRPLTVAIPAQVASGASGSEQPRVDSADAAWWQLTPGHLQVSLADYYVLQGKTHPPAIYVYQALAYAELVPAAFESIHRLQNYLYAPDNVPALDQLPGVPFFNAQILFAAHIQPVAFQNGKGIRYITEYAQYPASANNTDLFYNFIGVTSDGEDYVVAIFPLTNPVLADSSAAGSPLPPNGIPYPDMADPTANMDAYYIAVTDLLNAQLQESFTPGLAELDALIQSMWIEP